MNVELIVNVKNKTLLHLLVTPLRVTADTEAVERSKYFYRVLSTGGSATYALTPLGILHRLIGLTVVTDVE